MSGHSKWSQIKRQKGVADARRGQMFTKLAREIIIAAKQGGANPDANFRLRLAVQKARDSNMPSDNIERAIKKGSGGQDASSLVEITFEGYGPKGAAVLVEALTDNRNRTLSEVRNAFSRHGGNLGESGCVAWLFESRGVITVDIDEKDGEELALMAIDAGADDVNEGDGYLEVYTIPQNLEKVRTIIEKESNVISAEVSLVPKTTVMLDEKGTLQALKLVDHLEELDDVQRVFTNFDFSEEMLEKLRSQT
jgi:YebC/PmpR family DNA-binding regulatory protein